MSHQVDGNEPSARVGPIPIRLLIADDQPRARQSLEALLTALRWNSADGSEAPFEIVGAAADGQQAVEQVQSLHPDVVVMDLHTADAAAGTVLTEPGLDRLATIRSIKRQWPAVKVVVLTMYTTDRAATLLAGADAFLLKGCPTSELLAAVLLAVH